MHHLLRKAQEQTRVIEVKIMVDGEEHTLRHRPPVLDDMKYLSALQDFKKISDVEEGGDIPIEKMGEVMSLVSDCFKDFIVEEGTRSLSEPEWTTFFKLIGGFNSPVFTSILDSISRMIASAEKEREDGDTESLPTTSQENSDKASPKLGKRP